jgi:hypothetical protein
VNLDEVARLGSIPVRNNGGGSVSRGGRRAMQLREKGKFGQVCSLTGFPEEKKKNRGRDGHGCAPDGGRRGGDRQALGSTVARAGADTGEGLQRRQE